MLLSLLYETHYATNPLISELIVFSLDDILTFYLYLLIYILRVAATINFARS